MIRQINQVPDASGAGYYNPCSGALSIVMPSEAINQVMNPSFELYDPVYSGPFVGWTVAYRLGGITYTDADIGLYIRAGNPVWSGANAFYAASPSASGDFISLTYSAITLTQSRHFALSFYIYGASGSNRRTYTTRVLNGATVVAQKTFTLIEGQWQRVELVFLSSVTSSTATFVIEKSSVAGSWAGGSAYIDAVQFEQVASPDTDIGLTVSSMHATTYFDGDTEGTIDDSTGVYEYAWQGAPHRSRSVRYATTASGGRIYNLQDEFGLEIIGVAEASINQPQVQAIGFGSQDGGALQDIINPVRTVTFIGQLAGATNTELARKVQRLQALLSRDLYVNRQDRTFIFQHLNGRESIGVPMTFRGAFSGGLNVLVTDALTVNIDISVQMHDPYFYGHDEALRMGGNYVSSGSVSRVSQFDTDAKTLMLENVATGLNGAVRTIAQAPDGRVWIGGTFTQSLTGQSLPYICIYNPSTNAFSAVPGATLNAAVNIIEFDIFGTAWIGGEFTGAIGNYLTTHNGSAYTSTGNFNGIVHDIEIVTAGSEQQVYAVGAFTTAPGAITANRIARWRSSTGAWVAFSVGFNGTAFCITYTSTSDILYVGGSFTTTFPGVSTGRLAQINRQTAAITGLDPSPSTLNNTVFDVYVDADGTLVFGGEFSSTIQYLGYYTSATGLMPFPGFTNAFALPVAFPGKNSIFGYKGGIFVGAPSWIPVAITSTETIMASMSYWNGTALGGSSWIPIAGALGTPRYCGATLSDGTLMVGSINALSDLFSEVIHSTNSSTVQSYPTIRMVFGDVSSPVQVHAVVNVRDDKLMIFTDRTAAFSTPIDTDFVAYDLVTIRPKYGTITSATFGNLIRVLNLAGVFADFTIRPGVVSMAMIMATLTSNTQIDVYWRQTFQSLFDGVNKQ
jgi:hypothetical protein